METLKQNDSQSNSGQSGALWNILTVLVLLGVMCIAGVFLIIFINPTSGLNPFPPPPEPTKLVIPTPAPTATSLLPPTWTPTNTPPPTDTATPPPTVTPSATATFFSLITPSATPIPTEPLEGYKFDVQKGSPVAIANIYHPELGCNWMGVGGQAVDMSSSPVTGLVIRLGGVLAGKLVPNMTSLTGIALNYGRAGYEFTLAEEPIASTGALWVQLLDQSGVPLSDKVYFDTFEDCEKNLIIINFKQVRP